MYDLGNTCNYKCWYCFPGANTGTHPFPDVNIVTKNIKHLIRYYFDYGIKDINLNLLGGEPTVWKDLSKFIKSLRTEIDLKKGQELRISIQTNGSRTLRWWEENGKFLDHIAISVHHEKADPNHIVAVGNILEKQGVFCFATVLMDHKEWDKCVNLLDSIIKLKPNFMVQAVPINIDGTYNYNAEQQKFLKKTMKKRPTLKQILKHYNLMFKIPTFTGRFSDGSKVKTKNPAYFSLNKYNNFQGWECSIGIEWVYINRDGELTGTCNNKLYGKDFYYNIKDENFIEKFSPNIIPVICKQNCCLCNGEVTLSKVKL
jgi:organic radical activating enzyme